MKGLNVEYTFPLMVLLAGLTASLPTRKSKPEDLIATDSQIQFADTNGELKTSVNTEDSFRAETRKPDGSVKGVYGWIAPDGKPVQVVFKSDAKNGYQTFSKIEKIDVNLPPLPSQLYKDVDNNTEIKEQKNKEKILPRHKYRIPESRNKDDLDDNDNYFILEDDDALVRDGGDSEAVFLEEDGADSPDETSKQTNAGKFEIIKGYEDLLADLKPGTPVAQSNPSVTAIAGALGVAKADPSSSAIVGPGGLAISLPSGQALVGPGGIAISAPKSSSQAGPGGIAIAGIHSSAIAGISSGAIPADETSLSEGLGGDPGFFKRQAGSDPLFQGAAAPFITNYFIQFKMPEYYGAADPSKIKEKFYTGTSSGRRRSNAGNIISSSKSLPKNVYYEAPDLQSLSKQA